jgi:hypothetical protein
MTCRPQLDMSQKKLKLQVFYIRFGCGRDPASELVAHMDMNLISHLLQLRP